MRIGRRASPSNTPRWPCRTANPSWHCRRRSGMRHCGRSNPAPRCRQAPPRGGSRRPGPTRPAEAVRSTATDLAPTRRPVCLVERVAWSAGQEAYLVTARGFSPGHQQDAAGATTAGAAVWLQSTLVAD